MEKDMSLKGSINSTGKVSDSSSFSDEQAARLERYVWWKLDLSVVFGSGHYFLPAFLAGNARVAGLQKDLHLTNDQYSIALTVTFIPYIFAELPSNLLLKQVKIVGPNVLLSTLLVLWGVVTTLQGMPHQTEKEFYSFHYAGVVHNYAGLLACRFFLGLFEGGVLPGIVLYLSLFYPRAQLQKRLSVVFAASSLAGAFSGLLAAGISEMSGIGGRPGWAWIFILEGIFTVLFGILSSFFIPSSPMNCRLLKQEEKEYIMLRLREDGAISKDDRSDVFSWREVFRIFHLPHVWLLFFIFFFHGSHKHAVQYGSLFLTLSGINTAAPTITSWTANNTAPHIRRASAIAVVCMLTNMGGILSTWLLGSLSAAPRYTKATIVLLVFSIGLGVAAGLNVLYLWMQNKKKAELRATITKEEEPAGLGDRSAWLDEALIATLTVFYLLSWLDRTNLGNARIAGLQTDLRLTNDQYFPDRDPRVCMISLLYLFLFNEGVRSPYLCAELPVNLLLKIVGPNILLPTLMTLWGIVMTLHGTVNSFGGLLVCRFFLGLFEGGMLPAIVLYMSLFYPRSKLQRRLSMIFSASSLAGAFSGLLAAAILHMDGIGGKRGWAWIFILEGLFTVVFGIVSFFIIPESVGHCALLGAGERGYVLKRLREDGAISQNDSADGFAWKEVFQVFRLPHVWFILCIFFFNGIILYSLSYFTPSIVQALGWSGTRAQLMTVPPYAVGFVVTNLGSYVADHYKRRGIVIIICAACLTAGFSMFLASHSTSVQYGSLFLTIAGINAAAPAITSWVANNTAPHVRRASAIACACVMTNAGGILATWLIGSLSPPPRYTNATIVLLVSSVGLGIAAVGNVIYLWSQNRVKDRLRAVVTKEEEPEGLGDRRAWFTYIL
ncbi:hypothetical protein PC9H_010594 [Pleurotus ostreatus]|uniref:Major facilitator superfamily (MFS) profile domain-containing protein n=1 Tax=Pleurotus ostreatus TaxID=5322 RepID=A0A8H6ZPS1_PLEOS|nr:uncharacterized protein PC9H_010594 [Pleurotus ostreatus]KAF7422438.1 hypothetical protein PC9H_010594 [Pleurotus ostreatus]